MMLCDLRGHRGLVYVATPYARYPFGLDAAAYDAARHAGHLVSEYGARVFSPIAHSHTVARVAGIDPRSHEIWMAQNEPFMQAATVMVAVKLPGWQESVGMAMEAQFFQAAGKPIIEMEALA